MAPRFAAILAGIPTRIYGDVCGSVKEQYPDLMVLRGKGARTYSGKLAVYSDDYIEELMRQASDAVFGYSNRPTGFCRLPHRECAEIKGGKKNCGNIDGTLACGRKRPERLILAFQECVQAEADRLLTRFYFAPAAIQIPRECYDHRTRTSDAVLSGLERALKVFRVTEENMASGAPSVLLPPLNFGRKQLRQLIRKAMNSEVLKGDFSAFRQEYFHEGRYFRGHTGLAFKPGSHGIGGMFAKAEVALSANYRAGCSYASDFHWDVSASDGNALGGRFKIDCRQSGAARPTGSHVNLMPADFLRGS